MDLRQALDQYRAALADFARGDPEGAKKAYSPRDDVTLANPFGPAVHGHKQVAQALDFASARFRDGKVLEISTIAEYLSPELATIVDLEKWQAKISGRSELTSFELRVSSTFRREDGAWKLVHRHADPISKAHPDGPLRYLGA